MLRILKGNSSRERKMMVKGWRQGRGEREKVKALGSYVLIPCGSPCFDCSISNRPKRIASHEMNDSAMNNALSPPFASNMHSACVECLVKL